MRKNPHVRICGGLGSATTLVYPTAIGAGIAVTGQISPAASVPGNGGRIMPSPGASVDTSKAAINRHLKTGHFGHGG